VEIGDTLVILTSDRKAFLASGRLASREENEDASTITVSVLIGEATEGCPFRQGECCRFELLDNEDGTYEAFHLRLTPYTGGRADRVSFPRFIIGGALPAEEADTPAQEQATLF
jgi:hypothetical protein